MQTLPSRMQSRMHVAASVLTPKLREHAVTRGVPADLARHINVLGDNHKLDVAVHPAHQTAFNDHEWGSLTETPKAFVRTFQPELDDAWKHVLYESLLERVRGR